MTNSKSQFTRFNYLFSTVRGIYDRMAVENPWHNDCHSDTDLKLE